MVLCLTFKPVFSLNLINLKIFLDGNVADLV